LHIPIQAELLPSERREDTVVWVFVREYDELRCEVRPAAAGFDLIVWNRTHQCSTEHVTTALEAMNRQRTLERRLVNDGWELRDFQRSADW
jgi:hypothetical protein